MGVLAEAMAELTESAGYIDFGEGPKRDLKVLSGWQPVHKAE